MPRFSDEKVKLGHYQARRSLSQFIAVYDSVRSCSHSQSAMEPAASL